MVAGGSPSIGITAEVIEAPAGLLNSRHIEQRNGVSLDPTSQSSVDNIPWHWGFEFGVSDKEDNWKEPLLGKAEKIGERPDMKLVLMQRILETALPPIDLLSPFALFLRTEDPATIVLRLDDEDPERRDDHVVDLGGALSIGARQIEIVEVAIDRRIEPLQSPPHLPLSQPTLDNGGLEEFDNKQQTQKADDIGQLRKKRTKNGKIGHCTNILCSPHCGNYYLKRNRVVVLPNHASHLEIPDKRIYFTCSGNTK